MTTNLIFFGLGFVGTAINLYLRDWNAAMWSFSYMVLGFTLED
jgi:hypothetical protein